MSTDVSFGFYNSSNGDRKYSALQLARIFDGVITDGVFKNYGNHLDVSDARVINANADMKVYINTGRAWFNHTWTSVDQIISRDIAAASLSYPRIDLLVLEVDETLRTNDIKVITGTAASNPVAPSPVNTSTKHQYPLAQIRVPTGATSINLSNITNRIGSAACPWATGVLVPADVRELWESDWADLLASIERDIGDRLDAYLRDDNSDLSSQLMPYKVTFSYTDNTASCDTEYETLLNILNSNRPVRAEFTFHYTNRSSVKFVTYDLRTDTGRITVDFTLGDVIHRFEHERRIVNSRFTDVTTYTKIDKSPLVVHFSGGHDGTPECDTNYADIRAAYDAGRPILAYLAGSNSYSTLANVIEAYSSPSAAMLFAHISMDPGTPGSSNVEDWAWDNEYYTIRSNDEVVFHYSAQ